MKRITSLADISEDDRGACAAMGNFDGVHLGHRRVLDLARAEADARGAPLAVLTFEPHPREVFNPDGPPFRLTNAESKAHRLAKLGVDILFELRFDRSLFNLTDGEFCTRMLAEGLGLSHVAVGGDFHYGKGRSGNVDSLRAAGETLGFGVTVADLVTLSSGERVSSTAIREALAKGDPVRAREMLGHWHRIDGPVLHGEKRGRKLGYPTANMSIEGLHPPRFGVYAVLVEVLCGPHAGNYRGVGSLGVRPMFGENRPNIESHLFDFTGDLYDSHLSVGLVEYLRPEQKFDSLDALVAQMGTDSARARAALAGLG
ncbi:bifunctional riboflavin kinase/FAD synthetase [Tropicimonas sp. IMCC34043]|uniref:bifunctional riboflavin kinase/FAD synthetase n=1 Tax=Tropicimonas sp. IMCC34043 TaxID=2248760 RepID=UPI000E258403|nr:bifunctional riboflavin kinase/FAD synthetase [Tropicimonas sp. IMCC34043]